jgi:hypothetical protein
MRYYDLSLFNPQGQLLASTSAGFMPSTDGRPTFSSQVRSPTGQLINNPGALNIEFDIPVVGYATPQGSGWIRVSGVGLRTIGQASNLNINPATGGEFAKFILRAGWMKGLPLANDYLARGLTGVIAQGIIFSAFGNWQGTEQSLELMLQAGDLSPTGGINFVWSPKQKLSDALTHSLGVAFPDLKLTNSDGSSTIQILPGLVQAQSQLPVVDWYQNLRQLAGYIEQMTRPMGVALTGKDSYPGVQIGIRGKQIYASDGTQNPKTVVLAFQDLIGQPTWSDIATISFKTVLRADLGFMDNVMMPPDPGTGGTSIISALALTQQGAAVPGAPARNSSIFKGKFLINEVHHFANFRQADGDSWATAYTALAVG